MRYELIRISMMTAIIVGAFLFIMVELPDSAEAAQVTAQLSLDNAEQKASVGPGETGVVRFTGTVKVEMIGPGQSVQMIQVTLTASAGWPATVTPSSITFLASQTGQAHPFEVVVRVPNFTSFTQNGEVIIGGSVQTLPGAPVRYNIPETKGIISINPYFLVRVQCDEPYMEISPGDQFMYQLKIRNDGNTPDNINIKIDEESFKKLSGDHWVVTLSTNTIMVQEGKTENIPVSISAPEDWTLYRNRVTSIKITVRSETSLKQGSPETHDYMLWVRDKGIYIPGYDPILIVLSLAIVVIGAKIIAGRR